MDPLNPPRTPAQMRERYEELITQEFALLSQAIGFARTYAPRVTDWSQLWISLDYRGDYHRYAPPEAGPRTNDSAFDRLFWRGHQGAVTSLVVDVASDDQHEVWLTINGRHYSLHNALPQLLDLNEFITEQLNHA